jgi:hypothetical protein
MSNLGKTYDMSFSRNQNRIVGRLIGYAIEYGPITVRGLFYVILTTKGADGQPLITKKDDEKIGKLITKLRRAGAIAWHLVVDGSRQCHEALTFPSIEERIDFALTNFRLDPWYEKAEWIGFLIERDALTNVIRPTTDRFAVPLWPVRGYSSLTVLRNIAERIVKDGRRCFLYQLGDLDPSGDHATGEAREEINDFVAEIAAKTGVEPPPLTFERLAINLDQLDTMRIGDAQVLLRDLGRPTNRKDPRLAGYEAKYGVGFPSFELDILPPPVLRGMVEEAIHRHIDDDEIKELVRLAQWDVAEVRRKLA